MPLGRYLDAGLTVGLGSDVAGGPDLSLFAVMKAGAYTQSGRRVALGDTAPLLSPLDWLRLGTLEGARALGLEDRIGSIEVGKEADLIAVDPTLTLPFDHGRPTDPGARSDPSHASDASDPSGHADPSDASDPADLVSRLIFRHHPSMVCAAWVRGRLLPA
jgi:cytosine/adenosine deaminase-related metal-dependent hydrolase